MIQAFIPDMSKAPLKIIVKELKNNQFKLNNTTIKTRLMPEKMEKTFSPYEIGYRLNYKNKSLCFCGDNVPKNKKDIIALAKNCDVLLIENGSPIPTKSHLHPELVGEIATQTKAKKIIVTHFPPKTNTTQAKNTIAKHYKGPIIIAKDLMEIKI